jgi:class 3 adenylate cyclase
MISLDPDELGEFSRLIVAKGGNEVVGALLVPSGSRAGRTDLSSMRGSPRPPNPQQALSAFFATASPEAVELATELSGTPVINLPVVRLLATKPGKDDTDTFPQAELWLSGLLEVVPATRDQPDPDRVCYEFREDIREQLLKELDPDRIPKIVARVSGWIDSHMRDSWGREDLRTLLVELTDQASPGDPPVRPLLDKVFARISYPILRRAARRNYRTDSNPASPNLSGEREPVVRPSSGPTANLAQQKDAQIAERKHIADQILALLAKSEVTAVSILRDFHHTDDEDASQLWQEHPNLYAAVAERLIQEGHPGAALNLVLEWKALLPTGDFAGDPVPEGYQLRYILARAAVRGGNPLYAEQLLKPVLAIARGPEQTIKDMPTRLRVDIVALSGRILKDQSRQEPTLCALAAKAYEDAGNVPGADTLPDANTFPLVNAATMWRVAAAAEPEKAQEYITQAMMMAQKVIGRALTVVDAQLAANNYWLPATLGEASVIVGQHEEAVKWYLKAVEMARASGRNGDIVAMAADLMRLTQIGATPQPEWIANYIGNVLVFSGHLVDSPDRLAKPGVKPRFPNSELLVAKLAGEIQTKLAELNATVGFCSLACGSDILFAQGMLDRKAELHVVLPFAESDFLRNSVDYGLSDDPKMKRWADRFAMVLGQLPEDQVHYATREPYLGTKELFGFGNSFTQGLAVIRGQQRFVTPRALIVLDPDAEAVLGGTLHFRETWERAGFHTDVINLAKVLGGVPLARPKAVLRPLPEPPGVDLERPILALLTASVAGIGRISEELRPQFPQFLTEWGAILTRAFDTDAGRAAVLSNTNGNELFVVFNQVDEAAEYALTLLRLAEERNWTRLGLPSETPVRIGLHTGPVYKVDSVQRGSVYSGQHVNLTAQISSITLPGCAYCSEQFAALLTMTTSVGKRHEFQTEFVGIQQLKQAGRCSLYNLTRFRRVRR